jgi:hypothetical protein
MPPNLLGYSVRRPCRTPLGLMDCLNHDADDKAENNFSMRICRDFLGQAVVLLLGGLDCRIRYNGVGLTPGGAQEDEARVARMLAGEGLLDVSGALAPILEFLEKLG